MNNTMTKTRQIFCELDHGGVECLDCGMESTKEQYMGGDCQHWADCPQLIDDSDFSGADDDRRFAISR